MLFSFCVTKTANVQASQPIKSLQQSPAISITSSVTDYAELFPDKINCARMPECNSCEHNFTDDEMAAGWHMWSLDKEAEYSKEQARTSHDPIPPSASAVVDVGF